MYTYHHGLEICSLAATNISSTLHKKQLARKRTVGAPSVCLNQIRLHSLV
jgi:hypothetical protein